MKICMITTSEIFHDTRVLNEAEVLANKYEVTILSRKYPKQKPLKLPFKKMRLKLIDYLHLPIFQLNIFSSLISLIKAAFRENPDIYHTHDLDGLLCAFPAAILKRKILIYDSHELWSDTYPFANLKGIQWLLPILERLMVWRIKAGLTVNETIAKYLSRKYSKQFIALYNLSRPSKIKRRSLNLRKLFPEKKIILHLGAADEGRGMEQMIEAAQYLPRDYVLVFVGGGKIESQLKKMVEKLNLKDKIFLFGAVPPEEIVATIEQADLGLALTQKISKSYYFSLPNKIFQYIAAQTPILGSNFPEFKKIILKNDAGNIGQVVDPSKPKLIAQKITAMTKGSLKIYQQNLRKISEELSWKNETKKLLSFYQNLSLERSLISRKFKIDVLANILSLVFLGLAGIIINIVVARYYGAKTLGVFNEVYAIYILASQLAAFSVHLSVQKYLAAKKENPHQINQIVTSGIFLVLLFSLVVSSLIFFTRTIWNLWFHSPEVVFGLGLVSFGLIGFALNKTLLAVLNGLRKMQAFAFFQAFRYFLILGFIVFAAFKKYPAIYLPAAFSFAEGVLLIVLFFYCLRYFSPVFSKTFFNWLRRHFIFGYHALVGNVLLDVNTRVDIIILGFFVSQELVGVYSFGSIIAEGFSQLLVVLKTNVNPILAKLAVLSKKNLQIFINRGAKMTYQYFSLLAAGSLILYPILLGIFVGPDFFESWFVFGILLTGLAISAGYQPFQMLLAQAGFPQYYSLLILIVFASNVILNLFFVPLMGIYGSALATGMAYVLLAITLKVLTKKALKIKI